MLGASWLVRLSFGPGHSHSSRLDGPWSVRVRGADSGAVRTATCDGGFTHNTGNTFMELLMEAMGRFQFPGRQVTQWTPDVELSK